MKQRVPLAEHKRGQQGKGIGPAGPDRGRASGSVGVVSAREAGPGRRSVRQQASRLSGQWTPPLRAATTAARSIERTVVRANRGSIWASSMPNAPGAVSALLDGVLDQAEWWPVRV